MDHFFQQVFLNNTIASYLIVAGIVLLAFLFKRYLSKYIAGLLFRIVKKAAKDFDKNPFIHLVVHPLEIFLLLLIVMIALERLNFPAVLEFEVYKISFKTIVQAVSFGVLFTSFTWLLLRIIDFIAMMLEKRADRTADSADNQLIIFFKDFFKVVIVLIGLLLILKFAFHFEISSLLTGLSIATAAIALATRESLENLIASFIIFFDKPFITGDLVKVQNITGTVEKIGLRSTRIRTVEKTYVTVPNKQMVDSIMDNLSLRTHRRATVDLELRSDTPYENIHQLILSIQNLFKEKANELTSANVHLTDIGKNAYVVQIEYLTPSITIEQYNTIRQEINLCIIQILNRMNITLAPK